MMKRFLAPLILGLGLALSLPAMAQTTNSISKTSRTGSSQTYSTEEILAAGHQFFGKTTRGLAKAVEYVFQYQGEPTAYIVGEEGSGAFVGGLRYGEGTIYYKSGLKQKIYWQGPSVGFDFGANGSRSLVLVYNSESPRDLYNRFGGVEGSAYFIGGLGVNFQEHNGVVLAPIRTGVGARLGANIGYLKYSQRPELNPF
ncbi:MAG: DUF1134 domain-containing protein [Rhizobiales bacterium]|nr:DUF1134 domain-containing protein [Hyphomicrobiales bacterium]MBI3672736.1 DUF1134 domain-containing protein [Hyphomicrobiales bacterium]